MFVMFQGEAETAEVMLEIHLGARRLGLIVLQADHVEAVGVQFHPGLAGSAERSSQHRIAQRSRLVAIVEQHLVVLFPGRQYLFQRQSGHDPW